MKFSKSIILVLSSFLIGFLIFVFIGKWIGWQEIGEAFEIFTAQQGVIIVLLSFLIAIVGTLRWKEILKSNGIKTRFRSLFNVYIGGYSIMFLFPVLILFGEFYRVYGLLRMEKLSFPKVTASVVIERILEWTVNLFIVFVGLLLFFYKIPNFPKNILIVFGCAFAFFCFGIIYFYFKALRKKSIVRAIVNRFSGKKISETSGFLGVENEVFNYFDLRRLDFYKGIGWSLVKAVVMQFRVWLLILFLGNNVGFIHSLGILGFGYLSTMIPIPTSLGSHEIIQALAFKTMGLTASMATVFTMIIRAAEVLVSLFGLGYILRSGFNFFNNKFLEKDYENK